MTNQMGQKIDTTNKWIETVVKNLDAEFAEVQRQMDQISDIKKRIATVEEQKDETNLGEGLYSELNSRIEKIDHRLSNIDHSQSSLQEAINDINETLSVFDERVTQLTDHQQEELKPVIDEFLGLKEALSAIENGFDQMSLLNNVVQDLQERFKDQEDKNSQIDDLIDSRKQLKEDLQRIDSAVQSKINGVKQTLNQRIEKEMGARNKLRNELVDQLKELEDRLNQSDALNSLQHKVEELDKKVDDEASKKTINAFREEVKNLLQKRDQKRAQILRDIRHIVAELNTKVDQKVSIDDLDSQLQTLSKQIHEREQEARKSLSSELRGLIAELNVKVDDGITEDSITHVLNRYISVDDLEKASGMLDDRITETRQWVVEVASKLSSLQNMTDVIQEYIEGSPDSVSKDTFLQKTDHLATQISELRNNTPDMVPDKVSEVENNLEALKNRIEHLQNQIVEISDRQHGSNSDETGQNLKDDLLDKVDERVNHKLAKAVGDTGKLSVDIISKLSDMSDKLDILQQQFDARQGKQESHQSDANIKQLIHDTTESLLEDRLPDSAGSTQKNEAESDLRQLAKQLEQKVQAQQHKIVSLNNRVLDSAKRSEIDDEIKRLEARIKQNRDVIDQQLGETSEGDITDSDEWKHLKTNLEALESRYSDLEKKMGTFAEALPDEGESAVAERLEHIQSELSGIKKWKQNSDKKIRNLEGKMDHSNTEALMEKYSKLAEEMISDDQSSIQSLRFYAIAGVTAGVIGIIMAIIAWFI